jgi:hypothetical protein
MITNDARRTREIKSSLVMEKTAFYKKTFYQQTGLKCKKETSELLHLEHNFVGR